MSWMPLMLLAAALVAAQLDPAVTPQAAPKPSLPKVDQKACPFEGCQFGQWKAREAVQLFSTWTMDRKPIRTIRKGESVTGVTGVYITYDPIQILITAPIPEYSLKPGDIVLGYMTVGEGFFNAWFNGFWVDEFDGTGVVGIDGSGCRRSCNGKVVKGGRGEWWVKVETKDGVTGWTKETDKFDGIDALAARVEGLSATSAVVAGVAVRYMTGSQDLDRAGATYLLQKSNGTWRIAVVAVHDANRRLRLE